jgi:hypothetical protein
MRAHDRWCLPTDDRRVLEQRVFRELYVSRRFPRVLFVGCSTFTSWYPALFSDETDLRFETADMDPARAVHGSPTCHFATTFEALSQDPKLWNAYDLVILNGVFGQDGIQTPAAVESALQAAHILIRQGGRLLLGFRDTPSHQEFDRRQADPRLFQSANIPGLRASWHRTSHQNGHTFACFMKRVTNE